MSDRDRELSLAFAERRSAVFARLRQEMDGRGLLLRDGWTIMEATREVRGGTELVLRPMHLYLEPPNDLECVVQITDATEHIDSHCSPAVNQPRRPGS